MAPRIVRFYTCPILIVGGWIEIVQDFIVAVRRQFCLILGNTALEVIVTDQDRQVFGQAIEALI